MIRRQMQRIVLVHQRVVVDAIDPVCCSLKCPFIRVSHPRMEHASCHLASKEGQILHLSRTRFARTRTCRAGETRKRVSHVDTLPETMEKPAHGDEASRFGGVVGE